MDTNWTANQNLIHDSSSDSDSDSEVDIQAEAKGTKMVKLSDKRGRVSRKNQNNPVISMPDPDSDHD